MPAFFLAITLWGCQPGPERGGRVDATLADTSAYATPGPSTAELHNVLLVLVDDISPPKVSAYGESTELHTPVMDDLVRNGVWFRNAWAAPSCSPTRAALQTGRYGRRTGYGAIQEIGDVPFVMSDDEALLPAWLDQAPVVPATAMFGKWHLSAAGSPIDQGWDTWSGQKSNLVAIEPDGVPSYYAWLKTLEDETVVGSTTYVTTDTTNDAVQAVTSLSEPWVVHASYIAAHTPHEPAPSHLHSRPEPLTRLTPLERQRAIVEAMDTELGRLLDAIDPEVRRRTTVLLLGDNGEVENLREPGSGPGGKLQLLDGGIRVPFIAQGEAVPARGASDALVHVVDVVPTILDIAGVDPTQLLHPDGRPAGLDGHSLLPLFADPDATVRDHLYTELFRPNGPERPIDEMEKDQRAARDKNHKYIIDAKTGVEALFAYSPDHPEQGEVNLLEGELSDAEQQAYDTLRGLVEARVLAMQEGVPY